MLFLFSVFFSPSLLAGLVSLDLKLSDQGKGYFAQAGGPGSQAYAFGGAYAGSKDGALFLEMSTLAICSAGLTPLESICRAGVNATGVMNFDVNVSLNDAGKAHFESNGISEFMINYKAFAYGGYTQNSVCLLDECHIGPSSGGSAIFSGSLWQNGSNIVSVSSSGNQEDEASIQRTINAQNGGTLSFQFIASSSSSARLGPSSKLTNRDNRSFVYVDPIFSVDSSIENFVDFELIYLENKIVEIEEGTNPNSIEVSEPQTQFLLLFGFISIMLRKARIGLKSANQ